MSYIGATSSNPGCVFCTALAGGDDRKSLVLVRRQHAFLILNLYPYAPGHLMAVLNRHVGAVTEASPQEVAGVMELVGLATTILAAEYRAEGFNVGLNQGRVAGAGVLDHLHVHLVPRWNGDTNFMTVIGNVRVLPEDLGATARRLRPIFERLARSDDL
jgi:ATP adenylyltransferase